MARMLVIALSLAIAMPTSACSTACEADLNGDGVVDLNDLLVLLANWGPCPGAPEPGFCIADLDGDGIVGQSDLALMLASFGPCEDPVFGDDVPTFSVVPVDNTSGGDEAGFFPGSTHFTFDLQVTLEAPNDWTTTMADATLSDPLVTFYQHPFGNPDGAPPIEILIPTFPALEFDSYWTGASDIGPGESGGETNVGPKRPVQAPRVLSAIWFDTTDTGAGTLTIARYTLVVPKSYSPAIVPQGQHQDPVIGTITGVGTATESLGVLHAFAFEIILQRMCCAWDLNCDGAVGPPDLAALLEAWGPNPDHPADFNGDGHVGPSDLAKMLNAWGPC